MHTFAVPEVLISVSTASQGLALSLPTPAELSTRLFQRGKVAATAIDGWGESGANYLRLVFANEPPERLADLGRAVPRGHRMSFVVSSV